MLEIGVEQGNSTEAWSRYFYNAKHIYGIDFGRKVDDDHNTRRDHNGQEWTDTHTDDSIDGVGMHLKPIPCDVSLAHTLHRKERGDADTNTDNTHNTHNTRNTHNTDKNVNTNIFTCSIYHGDQSNIKFLDAFIEQTDTSGALDIIIDDGSHMPEHQLISFERLWLEVAPGGYYFIEDIETSYWKSRVQLYENLTTGKFNLVHHFKQVADTINREFSYRNIHSENKKDNDSSNSDSLSEDIYGTISTITFAQNLIILKKQTQWEKDTYFSRKYRFPEALPYGLI
jgi:hypothetical protein